MIGNGPWILIPESEADWPRVSARTLQALAACALLLLLGTAGLSVRRAWRAQAELTGYRVAVQALAETVRTMRARASARGEIIQLHVDAAGGRLQVVARHRGPPSHDAVEETHWLPEGLRLTETPALVTAGPRGELSAGTLLLWAPAHQRLFRLRLERDGGVHVSEAPLL